MKKMVLSFLVVFMLCSRVLANTISVDGAGAELVVKNNVKAQVIKEILKITPLNEPKCYRFCFKAKPSM